MLSSENVEDVYAGNVNIHSLHHKFFWFVKALDALNRSDENGVSLWHNLLRLTGVGGSLKFLYAARLESWLREKLNLGPDELPDDFDEDD
jgi:hypothetical protein